MIVRQLVFLVILAAGCTIARSDGDNEYVIHVRLHEGYTLSDLDSIVLPESVTSIYKSIGLPEDILNELANNGKARSGKKLPNMNLWQTIQLMADADPDAVLAELERNVAVDIAEKVLWDVPPPSILQGQPDRLPHRDLQTATPNFEIFQRYLNPAPDGIDAYYAWTQPGGTGAGIKVYDIEYEWNQNHEDLQLNVELLTDGTPRIKDPSHGTGVLGIMSGKDNQYGVKGICFDAQVELAPEWTEEKGSIRAEAIMRAIKDGTPGDVLLYEMQTGACNAGGSIPFGPAEWNQMVYDATLTATSLGFVVVAAAGNGNLDLDDAACEDRFNLDVRDSGAIIVGAGGAGTRVKRPFSTYGSRVDVQGYGEKVYSLDVGNAFKDPDNPDDRNRWYTSGFSGTSSASAIVAGAAVILQSYSTRKHGRRE
jgi:serine protease